MAQNREHDQNTGAEAAEAGTKQTSRMINHQRIQRTYAQQYRQAQQAKTKAQKTEEAVRRTVRYLKKHGRAALICMGVLMILFSLLGGISFCAMMVGSGIGGMFTASYETEDSVLLEVEAAYCAMEADLQAEIDAMETRYPDYDDYEYELDDIGHDPYVLISMLSALHGGAFTL